MNMPHGHGVASRHEQKTATGDGTPKGAGSADPMASGGTDPASLHPLVLAYVGDAAYELFVRSRLARGIVGSVNRLHVEATRYSRCESQAYAIRQIFGELGDKEKDIVRRARNAKPGYIPKHAGAVDYHNATGLEALVGYLYLKKDTARLDEVLAIAFERVGEQVREHGSWVDEDRDKT